MTGQKIGLHDFAKLLKPMEQASRVSAECEILLLLLLQILLRLLQILGLHGLLLLQMLDLGSLFIHLLTQWLNHRIREYLHGGLRGLGSQFIRFGTVTVLL